MMGRGFDDGRGFEEGRGYDDGRGYDSVGRQGIQAQNLEGRCLPAQSGDGDESTGDTAQAPVNPVYV
ncbi:unnamed protein product [Lampetra planeri]